jgi:hypothetical protein
MLLVDPTVFTALPILSVILFRTKAATTKNPTKKKIPPKDGPVETMTPGRE